MRVRDTPLAGLKLVDLRVFEDRRGFFTETYHRPRYQAAGIEADFVQDNLSRSVGGTLRGLHFQRRHPQAKLVQVLEGEIFDVAVDLRAGSPTFGRWAGFHLRGADHRQLFVPEGFAHGFAVLTDTVLFHYKCSDVYRPEDEGGLLWCDPQVGIEWPLDAPILSARDTAWPPLSALSPEALPRAEVPVP